MHPPCGDDSDMCWVWLISTKMRYYPQQDMNNPLTIEGMGANPWIREAFCNTKVLLANGLNHGSIDAHGLETIDQEVSSDNRQYCYGEEH